MPKAKKPAKRKHRRLPAGEYEVRGKRRVRAKIPYIKKPKTRQHRKTQQDAHVRAFKAMKKAKRYETGSAKGGRIRVSGMQPGVTWHRSDGRKKYRVIRDE